MVTSAKTLFPEKPHSQVLEVRTSTHFGVEGDSLSGRRSGPQQGKHGKPFLGRICFANNACVGGFLTQGFLLTATSVLKTEERVLLRIKKVESQKPQRKGGFSEAAK